MKWFRKTFLWASVASLSAAASASAQPAPVSAVTLGQPRPLAGVERPSYVARGARPTPEDEPKTLSLPKTLPLVEPREPGSFLPITQPVQGVDPPPKDKAKIIEIDKDGARVIPDKLGTPRPSASALPEDRIVILSEDGSMAAGGWRSWFRFDRGEGYSGFYARGEFLLWTTRGFHVPPLVTTASQFDPEATRGALGFDSTRLLFGDGNIGSGLRPGARVTLGYTADPCGLCAIEGNFFFLARKSDGAFFNSNTTPVIGRPFFNINTGAQDRELTTSPGIVPGDVFNGVGTLQITTSSTLLGAELNNRWLLWTGCDFDVSGLVGFRYLDLNDKLRIEENVTSLRDIPGNPGQPPISRAGDRILVFDRFDTRNQFYGGQFGLNAEWRRGPWFLETGAKVALGATHQAIDINGGQRISSLDGRVQNFNGGLYALSSNSGHFTQNHFAVVPEVGLKVGCNITENIRLFVGAEFMYWSSVVRPGDQIDQALDANLIPNSGAPFPTANQVRPRVPFRTTSYWATGLIAGVEIRY